jgi:hypothetical protein
VVSFGLSSHNLLLSSRKRFLSFSEETIALFSFLSSSSSTTFVIPNLSCFQASQLSVLLSSPSFFFPLTHPHIHSTLSFILSSLPFDLDADFVGFPSFFTFLCFSFRVILFFVGLSVLVL